MVEVLVNKRIQSTWEFGPFIVEKEPCWWVSFCMVWWSTSHFKIPVALGILMVLLCRCRALLFGSNYHNTDFVLWWAEAVLDLYLLTFIRMYGPKISRKWVLILLLHPQDIGVDKNTCHEVIYPSLGHFGLQVCCRWTIDLERTYDAPSLPA